MLPDKISIGAIDYKVEFSHESCEEYERKYHERVVGYHSFHDAKIAVDTDQSDEAKRLTFVHEIIHAIEDAVKVEHSEDDVERIANCLLLTLRRNPDVVFYLMDGVDLA
jgi:Zn-dependent peptidase ImmA (M78 family)